MTSDSALGSNNNKMTYGAVDTLESASSVDEEDPQQQQPPPNFSTQLAADRTHMAADRTAIAWVRTAISMIGFGVTIAKAADVLQSEGVIENSDTVKGFGVIFVVIAWLGLVLVIGQNILLERRLSAHGYGRQECIPLGLSMAVLVFICGLLGAAVIFHPIR